MILKILEKGSTKVYAPDDQVADYLFLGFADTGTTTEVVVTDPSKEIVEMKIEDDVVTAFRYKGDPVWRTVAGGGGGDTYKVKVDGTDTADYLENKLQQGTNVTITKSGGKLVVNSTGGSGSSSLLDPVADLAAIKAINTTTFTTVKEIQVQSLGLYKFQPASTLAGDDNLVIAPTTGTGRWVKQSIGVVNITPTSTLTIPNKTQATVSEGGLDFIIKKTSREKIIRITFIGSSVCSGTGASSLSTTYWKLIQTKLGLETDITYVVSNVSIAGNTTQLVLDRFANDVSWSNPDLVIFGLCTNNEGGSQTGMLKRLQILAGLCQERGYDYMILGEYPITLGTTPNDTFAYKQEYNFKASKLFAGRYVNWLGEVEDDRYLTWGAGLSYDAGHPNDAGHAGLESEFDYDRVRKLNRPFLKFEPTKKGYGLMQEATNPFGAICFYEPSTSNMSKSWTIIFDVKKGAGANGKSLFRQKNLTASACAIRTNASGYIEFCDGNTNVKFTSASTIDAYGKVQICAKFNYALSLVFCYVNGVLLGAYTPASTGQLAVFYLGGDNLNVANNSINYEFSNVVFYLSAVDRYSIIQAVKGEYQQYGVIFSNKMDKISATQNTIYSENNDNGIIDLQKNTLTSFVSVYNEDYVYTSTEKTNLSYVGVEETSTTLTAGTRINKNVLLNGKGVKATPLSTAVKKIVAIGSSVCAGQEPGASIGTNLSGCYVNLLATELGAEYTVINNSIYGSTTQTAYARFISDCIKEEPDIVILGFSPNNNNISEATSAAQALGSLYPFVQYLELMTKELDRRGIRYLITGLYPKGTCTTQAYPVIKKANIDLNIKYGARYINWYNLLEDGTGKYKSGYSSDNVHPNVTTHALMKNVIIQTLVEKIDKASIRYGFNEKNGIILGNETAALSALEISYNGAIPRTGALATAVSFKGTPNVNTVIAYLKDSAGGTVQVCCDSSGNLELRKSGISYLTTTGKYTPGFNRVLISYDYATTKKFTVYLNGVNVGTTATSTDFIYRKWIIGGDGITANTNPLGFEFKNMCKWNTSLGDTEALADFNGVLLEGSMDSFHGLSNIPPSATNCIANQSVNAGSYLLVNTALFTTPTISEEKRLAYINTVGTAVASATTIVAPSTIFHVTGTTAISTITVPYTGFTGQVTIIPDAIFTLVTGGNIAEAYTAVVGRAIQLIFDGATWYRVNS